MTKKSVFILLILAAAFFMVFASAFSAEKYELTELQGAWWSEPANPTADFSIQGDQVWLDNQLIPPQNESDSGQAS